MQSLINSSVAASSSPPSPTSARTPATSSSCSVGPSCTFKCMFASNDILMKEGRKDERKRKIKRGDRARRANLLLIHNLFFLFSSFSFLPSLGQMHSVYLTYKMDSSLEFSFHFCSMLHCIHDIPVLFFYCLILFIFFFLMIYSNGAFHAP